MNREILKSMDTGHIPVQRLTALLETFTLKHAARMASGSSGNCGSAGLLLQGISSGRS